MVLNQRAFTLIELIVIIVIIGILAAIAIPRYINLTMEAANGSARGILGALRSQNALMFGRRTIEGATGTYTMGDIAGAMPELRGYQWTASDTTFQLTLGALVYTFTLTPTPQVPTTFGAISAATTTW